jgi:hypothetical protein
MNRKLVSAATVLATGALAAGVAVAASSPSISNVSAASITTSSAVLKGTVNPNGSRTLNHFEYGLTTSYGVSSTQHSAGSGTKGQSVSTTAHGLLPGTIYHFRLVASNKAGLTVGVDHTFKTAGNPPPVVATGGASGIGPFSATLSGVINPEGASTAYTFQYGPTTAYGYETFGGTVPAGSAPVSVAGALVILQPGTLIHYRLIAVHGSIASFGADMTFMTEPFPRPVPMIRATTVPAVDRKGPWTFTTFGRITGPSKYAKSLECTGNTSIRIFNGRRQISFTVVPVQPDCSFSLDTKFRHLPGKGKGPRSVRLRIAIHFRGNGYLAPVDARSEFVRLIRP